MLLQCTRKNAEEESNNKYSKIPFAFLIFVVHLGNKEIFVIPRFCDAQQAEEEISEWVSISSVSRFLL